MPELEAYFRAADVFVLRVGPRGLLRPAGRGHGPRRPDRRLRRDRGARDGGRGGAGAGRQVAACRSRPPWPGCSRTRSCVRCWFGRAGSERRASTWGRPPGASSRSSGRPSAPPEAATRRAHRPLPPEPVTGGRSVSSGSSPVSAPERGDEVDGAIARPRRGRGRRRGAAPRRPASP